MAKFHFFMCFVIFLDLNEFLQEVGKSFVVAGGGINRP
jgi:hypothetical protein